MRIFKNAWFCRFARKEKIKDADLYKAVTRAEEGLMDADLGHSVIKQRIARSGQGKSGGYRTIILFRKGERAFFVYGFAKSTRANINDLELEGFRELAKELLKLTGKQLDKLVADEVLEEIGHEDKA